ncbi:MAG: HIT domain-containing protein [Bryobacteraceae bacterium]|nr:HIT domain-containing protein [Bryobacterales bacterium]MEB2360661.1 HIT domain-containing protein [Bryobacterales bacterium]NUN00240.1 HIT domain-containing protein [Bryobacteraceae bacterium]
MDRLWSPWRFNYVSKAETSRGCLFCDKPAEQDDRKNLIVYRASRTFVILNLFPYTAGHLMIAPYAHIATLQDASDEIATEMIRLARLTEKHLRTVYKPEGLNMGINLGECAGAGVAGHLHMHVVPRWCGDANFMTTVGETRVLPEDIKVTFEKLAGAFRGD